MFLIFAGSADSARRNRKYRLLRQVAEPGLHTGTFPGDIPVFDILLVPHLFNLFIFYPRTFFFLVIIMVLMYSVDDKASLEYICNKTAAPYFSNMVWFIGNHVIELDECLIAQAQ